MEIFVCPKDSISDRSVRALREAGVVVVQADDPERCKYIRAGGEEVGARDMLWAALKAMQIEPKYSYEGVQKVQQEFAKIVFGLVNDRREFAQAVDTAARGSEPDADSSSS